MKQSGIEYVRIERTDVDQCVEHLQKEDLSPGTVRKYVRVLYQLVDLLPPDRKLYRGEFIRTYLPRMQGERNYSISTVNSAISAYNHFMKHIDHAEFCARHLPKGTRNLPELNRGEYFRLLHAARRKTQHQGYLLIKTFANVRLKVKDLSFLTVETLHTGIIHTAQGDRIPIPGALRKELLAFADAEGFTSGPVFRSAGGRPLDRIRISQSIAELGRLAGIPEGKANPRGLYKLHVATADGIRERYEPIIEQCYDNLLESEQTAVRWER